MSDLQSLIERVEKATGPDREIDDAIWRALTPDQYLYAQSGRTWSINRHGTALTPVWEYCADPRLTYTASIDAALSLVFRVLPGAGWRVEQNSRDGAAFAILWRGDDVFEQFGSEPCSTPALAICLALLRAVQAQATAPADAE